MKLKRICGIVLALSLTVMGVPNVAFAANTSDTGFAFSVGPSYFSRTEYRAKTNTTSVYVNKLSGPQVTHFSVLAGNNVYQNAGKGLAPVSPGQKRLIHTYVYENGYRSCALASIANPYSGWSTGVWSPDSIGSYPYAN